MHLSLYAMKTILFALLTTICLYEIFDIALEAFRACNKSVETWKKFQVMQKWFILAIILEKLRRNKKRSQSKAMQKLKLEFGVHLIAHEAPIVFISENNSYVEIVFDLLPS